jgi:cytochrome c oxidase subunit III
VSAGAAASLRTSRAGMWLGLAAVTMLFLSLTSAYVVRQGLDPFWPGMRMPAVLPLNTLALLASSLCLEKARRAHDRTPWMIATLLAGLLFLAGQLAAWAQLRGAGFYFAANPHVSFFYTLTAIHALHLIGGLLALGWAAVAGDSAGERWLNVAALYWHFMGALWLYLLILLFGIN